MIKRLAGTSTTRSRAVVHNGLVYAVSTASTKTRSFHQQTKDALGELDRTLAECGTSKARLLMVTVYIADIAQKLEMNRAWDEWVDRTNPPQRACIGAALEGEDLVEIVAVAAI